MRLSIVTISYNQSEFLEEAIRSVVDQRDPELQYIVVDGGSSDSSPAIIERYRHEIDQIVYLPNSTPAQCLNRGFADAIGDIYGYINSDDALLPGALAKVKRVFERRPWLDVVSAHGWVVDAEGRRLHRLFSHKFHPRWCFYDCCTLVQQSTFFRAGLFKKAGGFDDASRFHWDGELMMEFANHGARFGIVHDNWSLFRVYPESLSGAANYRQRAEEWYRRQRLKAGLPEVSRVRQRSMQIGRWFREPITLSLRIADGLARRNRVL